MKKILSLAIAFAMVLALCISASAQIPVPYEPEPDPEPEQDGYEYEYADDFEYLNFDFWNVWDGVCAEDGKLVLGEGEDWVAGGPAAYTRDCYGDYTVEFDLSGDGRDCYYGFGLRSEDDGHLMNGGRFGVMSYSEKSFGIAVDLFGAANSTLNHSALGITFCNWEENGAAPSVSIPYTNGYNGIDQARIKAVDSGDNIIIYIDENEAAAISLSELEDDRYKKAVVSTPVDGEIGEYGVDVPKEGTIVIYQRNNRIEVENFRISFNSDHEPYYQTEEYDWKWISGEPFEYSFWEYGEPSGGDETKAGIWGKRWNDWGLTTELDGFVCEWDEPVGDAKQFEDHCYKIINGYCTWEQARIESERLGGYLACITSSEEEGFIESLNREKKSLWIGAYRDEIGAKDTWLCDPAGNNPGYWMQPFTEGEWEIKVEFDAPHAFDGFRTFFFANPEGAEVRIELLDRDDILLESFVHTQYGDGYEEFGFSKAYTTGNYKIRIVNSGEGERFALSSGYWTDECYARVYGNYNTNDQTLERPYIMLTGCDDPGPQRTSTSLDRLQINSNVIGKAENVMYDYENVKIDPYDKMYVKGWALKQNGAALDKFAYTVDGGEFVICDGAYGDRPDAAKYLGFVTNNGVHAGFGLADDMLELAGIGDLPVGEYYVEFHALFEDGTSCRIYGINLKIGEVPRVLSETENGILNIVIEGATEYIEAEPGETVDVRVKLVNNPGISSARVVIEWDGMLTLENAVYDIYNENNHAEMINVPDGYGEEGESWADTNEERRFVFNWLNATGAYDGEEFLTLTFRVSENAKAGDFLNVFGYADQEDIFEDIENYVEFTVLNGGIDVVPVIGDADNDGRISNRDVVKLFRYVSGDDKLYVKQRAGDVNQDGEINNKDVVLLFKLSSSIDR